MLIETEIKQNSDVEEALSSIVQEVDEVFLLLDAADYGEALEYLLQMQAKLHACVTYVTNQTNQTKGKK